MKKIILFILILSGATHSNAFVLSHADSVRLYDDTAKRQIRLSMDEAAYISFYSGDKDVQNAMGIAFRLITSDTAFSSKKNITLFRSQIKSVVSNIYMVSYVYSKDMTTKIMNDIAKLYLTDLTLEAEINAIIAENYGIKNSNIARGLKFMRKASAISSMQE